MVPLTDEEKISHIINKKPVIYAKRSSLILKIAVKLYLKNIKKSKTIVTILENIEVQHIISVI